MLVHSYFYNYIQRIAALIQVSPAQLPLLAYPSSWWYTETAQIPFPVSDSDELFKVVEPSSILHQFLTTYKGDCFVFYSSRKGYNTNSTSSAGVPCALPLSNIQVTSLSGICVDPEEEGYWFYKHMHRVQSSSAAVGQNHTLLNGGQTLILFSLW